MRAYVSGALMNVPDLAAARALYERLGDACALAGCAAYVPHQHADPERDAGMPNLEVARRDLDAIAQADILVAELSEPSLGVGAEIVIALHAGKRVLALAAEGRKVSRFILGLLERHDDRAVFFRYRTVDDACAWLTRSCP
jgi:nucleoside 2-deoxyribosyltransferase